MSVHSRNAISKHRWAQALVLLALVGVLAIGWHENREVSPADIPLENLPRKSGTWETVREETSLAKDNAYKLLRRTYEDDKGQKIYVTVHATHTRLGGLRDWSLASMASGWSVKEASIRKIKDDGNGCAWEASIQKLVNGPRRRVALNWYTSAHLQAPTLQLAAFNAWPDWLLTGRKPWANMYLLAEEDSNRTVEEGVRELAQRLAPQVRNLMALCRARG